MGRKPNPDKRRKNVQISISMPKELVGILDRMAGAQNRNRSNFIANVLAVMAKECPTQPESGKAGKRAGDDFAPKG